jgi:hypothetical protein
MMHPKPFKVRSEALRRSAKGQSCTIRLPGVCLGTTDTTVLCHLPGHAGGMGTKEHDLHAAYGCRACHDCIDRHEHARHGLTDAIVLDAMLRALSETQERMVRAGLIVVRP